MANTAWLHILNTYGTDGVIGTLGANITSNATSIDVGATAKAVIGEGSLGEGLPLAIAADRILLTAFDSGTTYDCTRDYAGSTGTSHDEGDNLTIPGMAEHVSQCTAAINDIEDGTKEIQPTITGGTVDGAVIGGVTPAAISGTTGDFSGNLAVNTNDFFVNTANGRIGTGTTNPGAALDILEATGRFRLANTSADNTQKIAYIVGRHYTNSEQNISAFFLQSTGSSNILYVGGGSGDYNAMEEIRFYTAADDTTVTGTLRGTVTNAGVLEWVGGISVGGALKPRTLVQAGEPAAGTGATQIDAGEELIWVDSDDSNAVYKMYNYSGTVSKVALT
ncbi:unnamed protein product [marine sediment metagenome]|uniref:Major tropism determinant N-terminal domain-containing protein n=1 Tax=marine sediment metagenome TaxID=412755 RepID=X0S5N6_9ZZZZ